MQIRLLFNIFCCHLLFLGTCLAQSAQLQHFTGKDGLAQSQVYCLLEDQRGYLWLGTQGGGLNRFDGKQFKTWRTKDGLPNNFIDALFEDQQGHIWVGTKNGLSSFNGFEFKNYKIDEGQDLPITTILQKTDSALWVGTKKGLYTFDKNKWEIVKDIPASNINQLYQNSKGLWVATSVGLYRITNDKVKKYGSYEGILHRHIQCISEDKDGTIWLGTDTGGIYLINGDQIVRKTTSDGIHGQFIQTIFKDQSGNMWIGSQGKGISIWNPTDSTFQYLTRQSGLLRNDIRAIIQDHWGHIWIGTPGGLSRYAGRQFGQLMVNDASNDNNIYALCEDSLHNIWLSASSKGIAKLQNGQIYHYGLDSGFIDVRCKALFADNKGRIWIGTEQQGLALYDGKEFRFFSERDGLKSKFIKDILQDSSGLIWLATTDGIYTIRSIDSLFIETTIVIDSVENQVVGAAMRKDTTSREYFVIKPVGIPKIKGAYTYTLHLDRQQRLWFAARNQGIGCIVNDSLVFQMKKNSGLPDNHVRSLATDQDGFLWIGTANAGILRIDIENEVPTPVQISESDGLNANNVYSLLFDDKDNLWAGSGKGVDYISLNHAREVTAIQHFDQTDGFAGIETCTNAVLKDTKGNIWFGTVNGLMQYLPEIDHKNTTPPVVHISGIRIGYKLLQDSDYRSFALDWGGAKNGLVLPYGENQISFEFVAVHQAKPDQISYEYILQGWDKNWVGPYSQNAPAHYSNLTPGNYTFKVRASSDDGRYKSKPLSWSFSITPPFWQSTWFYIACILSGLLLIFLLAQLWSRRIRRQAAAKTERLEMEKTMLELEQKALQLQMNPHFIFNVLNSIQSLISQKDEKTARYFLAKFSKLMRSILENSRSTKIPLEQEIETLEHYLSVERFSRDNQFDYDIYVDPNLDIRAIMIAPMLLQPFLENAIVHGVAQVKEGGRIKVSFIQKYGTMECAIEDNGPGLAAAKQRKSQLEHNHKSAALDVTRERLDILNPLAKGKSLEIIDRGEEGTKVVVRLLLS